MSLMKHWRQRGRELRQRIGRELEPGAGTKRGLGIALRGLLLAVAGLLGTELYTGLGLVGDFLIGVLLGGLFLWMAELAFEIGRLAATQLPRFLGWWGATGLLGLVLFLLFTSLPPKVAPLAALAAALPLALTAGGIGYLLSTPAARRRRAAAWVARGAAGAGLVLTGGLLVWLLQPGSRDHLVEVATADEATVTGLGGPDPGLAGPHDVAHLTYGSGTDRRRLEFRDGAAWRSPTVDATPLLDGLGGWRLKTRTLYWGFGPDAFPLNGRVWYPQGEGPFPLVLIVHGNHNMMHFSDPGYAYLGEHLASRGFILVSVDQNFLNGSAVGSIDVAENDARGWILLEHLRLWRQWSADPDHPFFGRVDLDRTALIGHSRGGEAVAIAAAFNRLPAYPDDASLTFDYGFSIRSLIAIAPSDGQYRPAGRPTPLENVSYLVLQGGHDGDVSMFLGDRQFHRVALSAEAADEPFKASVWIYRANHGQFNTVWGQRDTGGPRGWLLNVEPLLAAEEQRRAGRVLITAFLEETLRESGRYRELFRDLRRGRQWLPETLYVSRFRDSSYRALATFDDDLDLTTASAEGARIRAAGFEVWREEDPKLRRGVARQRGAVRLGWSRDEGAAEAPSFEIELPAGLAASWGLGSGDALALDLAAVPHRDGEPEADGEAPPIDLTVELVDEAGVPVALALSHFRPLLPPLPVRFTRLAPLERERYESRTEPLFQTFELPLEAFARAAPGFDPARLRHVGLRFDRTPAGEILLDEVGFARVGTGAVGYAARPDGSHPPWKTPTLPSRSRSSGTGS